MTACTSESRTEAIPTPSLPPVLVNCMPKAGTHLIKRLFQYLPHYTSAPFTITRKTAKDREDGQSPYLLGVAAPRGIRADEFEKQMGSVSRGSFVIGHLPYTPATRDYLARKGFRMILLLRTPQDIACSMVFAFINKKTHTYHPYFSALPDLKERFMAVFNGIKPLPENHFTQFLPLHLQLENIYSWRQWPQTHTVWFEDLIGPDGGGTSEKQVNTIKSILQHLDYPVSEADIPALAALLYHRTSGTFRKGMIGDWRNHFSFEISHAFDRICRPQLEKFFHREALLHD